MNEIYQAPNPSGPEERETEAHISEYLDILYKRKKFILLFMILFITVVMIQTCQTVPLFSSSAKLVVEPKNLHSPITGKRIEYETNAAQILDMGTHFKLIKSKPVAKSVIEDIDLAKRLKKRAAPGLFSKLKQQIVKNIKSLMPESGNSVSMPSIDPATRKMNALVKRLQAKIKVKQIKKTRLILISAQDENPRVAADIANGVARKYIEFDLANRVASSRKNLEWMNNELYDLKKELEDNERAFFFFFTKNKVFSMEGKQKVAGQKIAEFNNRYLETRNKRLDLDSKINELERHLKHHDGLVKVRSLISNNLIEEVYNKIVNLEIELTKLSKIYKSKHPKIVQIKSEIEKSRIRLDFELSKELASLKSERAVIAANEKILEKTIGEFEQDALDSSSNELTYSILQRNVKTSQKLYDTLLSRIKESDILKDNAVSNIRIVEKADIPYKPFSPRKRRNFLLAVVFGFMGGCLLAFFFEYMDQTLRTQEDVQSYLDLPVLSVIPEASDKHGDPL